MKPKTLILMFVAIGCGLVASYMTSRVIAERGEKDPVEQEKVAILVAKQNIPMAVLFKDPEKYFEEKQYVKGEEPKKAIKTFDLLKDKRLNKPLNAEQFVTEDDLDTREKEGLSARIQKGMRAHSIKVSVDSVAGGFILPGNRVDIVSVVRRSEAETFSKIILQNILVLGVDQNATRPEDKQNIVASTVTVEVKPEQSEKLSLANEQGTLRLILRAYGDDERVTTAGATPKGIQRGTEMNGESDVPDATPRTAALAPTKLPDIPAAPPVVQTVKVEDKKPEPKPEPPKKHVQVVYNGEVATRHEVVLSDGKSGEIAPPKEEAKPEVKPTEPKEKVEPKETHRSEPKAGPRVEPKKQTSGNS
jgi:pilus assembly protein CpaB